MATVEEQRQHHAEDIIKVDVDAKRKWTHYIWDTFDKSPEERKFLFKLDAAVLTFASLGYFIKYLDQSNITNAFVSGMRTDLGLFGNQLNYMQTCWTVGYVVGQVPSNLILTRVRPSIWIPTLELTWSILTFCLSQCNTAQQLYAVRFLVGLAESGFYPGMQYLIGSWYRKDELGKRSCIFHTCSAIATMFSGYLMAAVYNLGGTGGMAGWQWLFIVDGIISAPIALLGYIFLPDLPENSRAFYLNDDEKAFARRRMELAGRKGRGPFTKAKVKKIFSSWHIYLLTLGYVTFNNAAASGQPIMQMFLYYHKNPKYKTWQINVWPTGIYAVQVVTTLAYAWSSDTIFKGARWPPMIVAGTVSVVIYISLSIWNIPEGWHWACYYLSGFGGGLSGLWYAWCAEICADDNEERALVSATMNEMAYVVQAWLPLLVWQQVDAPEYRKGYITVACIALALMATAMTTRYLHNKEMREKQLQLDIYDRESNGSSDRTPIEEYSVPNKI